MTLGQHAVGATVRGKWRRRSTATVASGAGRWCGAASTTSVAQPGGRGRAATGVARKGDGGGRAWCEERDRDGGKRGSRARSPGPVGVQQRARGGLDGGMRRRCGRRPRARVDPSRERERGARDGGAVKGNVRAGEVVPGGGERWASRSAGSGPIPIQIGGGEGIVGGGEVGCG